MSVGILDKEFNNLNPLNNLPYSEEYKKIFNKLIELAAYEDRFKVIETIQNNQVIIITAQTGVGKTVWIPKFVLHAYNYQGKIAVTNPKKITTKSNAQFMSESLDVKLGEHVGYKYRGSPSDSYSENTNLLFCTDGYLSARILGSDPLLSDFNVVILDEIHERKVNMDLLLYLLREVVSRRKDFKLILVSATLNEKIFEDYYPKDRYQTVYLELTSPTTYPIEIHYSDHSIKNYIMEGIDMIVNLLETTNEGDILFFVTSSKETDEVCRKITERTDVSKICIRVYSGMDSQEEDLMKSDLSQRKLLIATNVVESSLTVEGLKYVIDSGKELFFYYDPNLIARVMRKQWTTKAQIKQRRGRVGRTSPGIYYALFTEQEYDTFEDYPLAEIQKSDITYDVLRFLKNEKTVKKTKELLNNFIEPPHPDLITSAFRILYLLNAIDKTEITSTGLLMLETRVNDVYMAKSLIKSYKYGCAQEMSIIISFLEAVNYKPQDIFITIESKSKKRNEVIKKLTHKYGDHLTLLNIYQKYRKQYNPQHWCYNNFIKYNVIKNVKKNARQYFQNVHQSCKNLKTYLTHDVITDRENNISCLLRALFRGLYINTGNKKNNEYELHYRKKGLTGNISRSSFLNEGKFIIFNELFISENHHDLNVISKLPEKIIEPYKEKILKK